MEVWFSLLFFILIDLCENVIHEKLSRTPFLHRLIFSSVGFGRNVGDHCVPYLDGIHRGFLVGALRVCGKSSGLDHFCTFHP